MIMLIYVKQHLSKKSSKSYSNTEAELKKKALLNVGHNEI